VTLHPAAQSVTRDQQAGSWKYGGEKQACTTPFREQLRRKESIQHPLKTQQQF